MVNLEVVQTRYIKWCLRLEKSTSKYIVLEETKRDRMTNEAGIRALKFEAGIKNSCERVLAKECLKEK